MNKGRLIFSVIVYLLLAILFFFVRECDCEWLLCRRYVAIPTLFATFLTALHFKRGGWLIPLALLASAAGDWAGAMGEFIFQVAFFAVTHIFYVADFAPKCKFTLKRILALGVFSLIVLLFLVYVVMQIENRVELIAVAIYGLIIYSMGFTALIQNRKYSLLYAIAAMLFIFSDSCIAYNRFVEYIPNATLWIMTTYYAAQGIFCTLHLLRGKE